MQKRGREGGRESARGDLGEEEARRLERERGGRTVGTGTLEERRDALSGDDLAASVAVGWGGREERRRREEGEERGRGGGEGRSQPLARPTSTRPREPRKEDAQHRRVVDLLARGHHHATTDRVERVRRDTGTGRDTPSEEERREERALERARHDDRLERVVHAEVAAGGRARGGRGGEGRGGEERRGESVPRSTTTTMKRRAGRTGSTRQ